MDSHRLLRALPSLHPPASPPAAAFGRPSTHSRPLLQRTADGYAPPIVDVPERDDADAVDAAPLTAEAALHGVQDAMRLAARAYGCTVIVASDADMLAQLYGGRQLAEDASAIRVFGLPLAVGCRELPTGRAAYAGVRVQVSASALRLVLAEPALGPRIADALLVVAACMHATTSAGTAARYAAGLTSRGRERGQGDGGTAYRGELRTRRLPDCGQGCAACIGGTARTAHRWQAACRTLEMERLARVAADGDGMLALLPGGGNRNGRHRTHAG